MSPMETLKRTAVQLSLLALPLRQRREMEHGPTLWALACFISMLPPIDPSPTVLSLLWLLTAITLSSVFLSVCQ